MRRIWPLAASFILAIAVLALPPRGFSQAQPDAKPDAAAICHQCEWIKIQIGDIDDKIASWERQIRSINKYSDLTDPNIQNALKDIGNKIADLKAKKADLEAKLADCQKRCAEAKAAETRPVMPGPPPSGGGTGGGGTGGGGTGGGGTGGGGTGGGQGTDTGGGSGPGAGGSEPPKPVCPPDSPMGQSTTPSGEGGGLLPKAPPLPPAPKNPDHREDWDHLINHMNFAEGWFGDEEDVWDVSDDIDDALEDAYGELADNPNDADAQARLDWLKKQADYYARWRAQIRRGWLKAKPLRPFIYKNCYPPIFDAVPSRSNGEGSSFLDHFSIGIGVGVGGGGHDREGDRGRNDNGRDTQPRATPRD